jgi:hypothetical protein
MRPHTVHCYGRVICFPSLLPLYSAGLIMSFKCTNECIVDEIVADLCGRRGLRQEWEEIDEETQKEIKLTWRKIIHKHVDEYRKDSM